VTPNAFAGFRLAIVGTCQVTGLADWSRRMLPGAHVDAWHVGSSPKSTAALIVSALGGYDLIITQFEDSDHDGLLAVGRLQELCPRVMFVPFFLFRGFHPDVVILADGNDEFLQGPMEVFHSEIVYASFRLRIPPARVTSLFNNLVFRSAGYPALFANGRAALVSRFAGHGYDLEAPFQTWMADGPFMYIDNHPHIRVLETLTRLALGKAGVELVEKVEAPPDYLAQAVQWPVYPDWARSLGVSGSMAFRRGVTNVASGEDRDLSATEFIASCYRIYADRATYRDPSIERMITVLEDLMVTGDLKLS
jgi:hypothetical protein